MKSPSERIKRRWYPRAVTFLRMTRLAGYACVAVAGFWAVFLPPISVQGATNGVRLLSLVWAGVLGLSSAICALGVALNRWVGEWIGLIPLALVTAAFGLSALSRGSVSVAGGVYLLGVFWLFASRWQEVALLKVEADRHRERQVTA